MNNIKSVNVNQLALIADKDTLTITPNNRTAACLTKRVVNFVLKQSGKKACVAPNILPLSLWVVETFKKLRAKNIMPFSHLSLIGDRELVCYWVRAMHFDKMNDNLVNPTEWLSDAINSDKILSRWLVKDYEPDSALSANCKRWRYAVHKEMSSKGFVTESMGIELIINAIKKGDLEIPEHINLYAFDEKPPLYKKLFDAFAAKVKLSTINPIREGGKWLSVATADSDDQLSIVAKWASKIVENEPGASVCIVSPDMKKNRDLIVRRLNDVFEPQWILPESGVYSAPYNVSLGTNLKEIKLFSRALYYLSLESEQVPSSEVLNVIRDPFICPSKKERLLRRGFSQQMRDNRAVNTSLVDLAMKATCTPKLSSSLNAFVNINTQHPQLMLPSRWAKLFHDALTAIGWAKGVSLNQLESMGIEKWQGVLDSLSCLDIHTGEIPRDLAYKIVNQYCINALVTPASLDSPISVMGTLEAAGLDFTYTWILDCNDGVFPAKAVLNSCLPTSLQIKLSMPHSCGEKEYEFTNMLFNRYKGSCSELYTSFVESDELGIKKPASVLAGASSKIDKSLLVDDDIIDYQKIAFQQFSVESKKDEMGVVELKNKTLKGGVALVDQIGLCGMQAVTNKRLGVNDHKPFYTMGFTGAERGNVLHNALENFWECVIKRRVEHQSDHHYLTHMSEVDMRKLIENSVDVAFFWVDRTDITEQLISQEKELIIITLMQWLEVEKKRQPFDVVALEKSDFVELGEVKLAIRLDRVDKLIDINNNDKKLALDYKSKEHSLSSVFSSSPASQLPLAVLSADVDGVAYANVVPNSPSLKGLIDGQGDDYFISVEKHKHRGPKDWEKLKSGWLTQYSERIKRFVSGDVNYSPSSKSCAYCVKKSLCEYAVR